jgi:putative tryptophan/tyrosine transport system substrate-binding protein
MKRRNLVFGLLVVAAMGTAHAQQSGKVHRIAVVHPSHPVATLAETSPSPVIGAIFTELRRLGYVEGKNILIERYSGGGRAWSFPELAPDVVRRNPDVIMTFAPPLALDFKAATTTIPIVGVFGSPLENGIVPSLARPGGNITGVSLDIGGEQWQKRLQLLKQMVPQATRLAIVDSRENRERSNAGELEFSRRVGLTRVGSPLNRPIDETEYRRLFAALAREGAEEIIVTDEAENVTNFRLIIELAEKGRLPAIYPFAMFVKAGGLMFYGVDLREAGDRAANMIDQILKGAKPGEIPIFQPTKFELAINLKTAKALDLTVPPELLATADEVIEGE